LYKIGDTGPAVGIIFYVEEQGFAFYTGTTANDNTTVKRYYLEASRNDLTGGTGSQTTMRWSTATTSPYPTVNLTQQNSRVIGTGRRNTAIIIAAETLAYPGNPYIYAALACDKYGEGTDFNDWFLPSLTEIQAMNIAKASPNNVAGLPAGNFWTSSASSTSDVADYWQFALNGSLSAYKNSEILSVRAVRAF
jgi:hypothetical protein